MTTDPTTLRRDNVGTGLIVLATAFSAVAVLVFQALGSRTLGTEAFAPIAVLWTLMFLIYTILQLPAEQHLTRALAVTHDRTAIRRVRNQMAGAFGLAVVVGVSFVWFTLDRFFEGDLRYVFVTGLIMVTRSIMAAGRGTLAGHRRFAGYGSTIALEAAGLLVGGIAMALLDMPAIAFTLVLVVAPLASLLARPFAQIEGSGPPPGIVAQRGSFLVWLILATGSSQLIIAGGPIAVSFVGGSAAAVSIYFTTFALLRGPVTSAYSLVARVLPDFTALANSSDPGRLWAWAPRLAAAGVVLAILGATGTWLFLDSIVSAIYGPSFVPPTAAAVFGGAGIGLGLGALFATQIYSAADRGPLLAAGWGIALLASLAVLVVLDIDPIERAALAFAVGEGVGLATLGLVFPFRAARSGHRVGEPST